MHMKLAYHPFSPQQPQHGQVHANPQQQMEEAEWAEGLSLACTGP